MTANGMTPKMMKNGSATMNAKELQEYNESRRKYHKLLSNELGHLIVGHILCKTKRMQGIYRLEANAAEEVEQELSIAAFKSRNKWKADMSANKHTYMVRAINKHAAYLGRQFSKLPITENYEHGTDIRTIGEFHKTTQERSQRLYDKNDSLNQQPHPENKMKQTKQRIMSQKERPRVKPSVVSCGSELAEQLVAKPICDNSLKMDIEAFFASLSLRQQIIILMLEEEFTHDEIAEALGLTQPRIVQILHDIQEIFLFFQKSPYENTDFCNCI